VRLGGIIIGRVDHVGFTTNLEDPRIHIALLINTEYLERIGTDSVVTIQTQGLLGDKYLNVSTGQSSKQLPEKSTIKSREAQDITQVLEHITTGTASFADMMQEIAEGEGLLHSLIYSQGEVETIENLQVISEDIRAITNEIRNGKGLLHELIYDQSTEGIGNIIKKLDVTASNFKQASEALTQGSGTIGALLIDSQLYDNLVEVTDEAKRSWILRQAIKSSLKE